MSIQLRTDLESKRQRLSSEETSCSFSDCKPLPLEIWCLVASYLQADDLKSLSKASRICKAAALGVQNAQELKKTSEKLQLLANLNHLAVIPGKSTEDVYKNFVNYRSIASLTPGLRIDPIRLEKLQETLTALVTDQLSVELLDLSQNCFKEINEAMLCINCVEDLYLSKKHEFFLHAFNHIIAACADPSVARGVAVVLASKSGNFHLAVSLLKNGETHEYHRGRAVFYAVAHDNIAFIEALLANGQICDLNRGMAIEEAAQRGHLDIIKLLLSNGPIFNSYQNSGIKKAKDKGYYEIAALLEKAAISQELD